MLVLWRSNLENTYTRTHIERYIDYVSKRFFIHGGNNGSKSSN